MSKIKKNQKVFNSEWSDEALSYFDSLRQRRAAVNRANQLEEERRLQEERIRQESARSQVTSLEDYGRVEKLRQVTEAPPKVEEKEEAPEDLGRWGALRAQVSGTELLKDAAATQFELGDTATKYKTPEQRAAARKALAAVIEEDSKTRRMDGIGQRARVAIKELKRIDEAEELFSTPGAYEAKVLDMEQKKAQGRALSGKSEAYFDATGNVGTRLVGDVLGSWEAIGSIAGGLAGGAIGLPLGQPVAGAFAGATAGSIPATIVARNMAYSEGKDAGMNEEQATKFAYTMASIDHVISTIGVGGAAALSSFFKQEAKKRVTSSLGASVTGTALKQGGLGALEEGAVSATQMGVTGAMSKNEEFSKRTREYLMDNAALRPDGTLDFGEAVSRTARSAAAGGVVTGGVGGAGEFIAVSSEMGKQASILQKHLREQQAASSAIELVNLAQQNRGQMPPRPKRKRPTKKQSEAAPAPSESLLPPTDLSGPLQLPPAAQETQAMSPVDVPPAVDTTKKKEKVPPSTSSEVLAALEQAPPPTVALPSRSADTVANPAQLSDIEEAFLKKSKDTSRLAYLVQDGNLQFVQRQEEIGSSFIPMDKQGRGWYDPSTGKVSIVAGNLDKTNLRGEVMSVLTHEVKHGGDFGVKGPVARSFSKFIGPEANQALVTKIREAATKGDESAQAAVSLVDGPDYQSVGLTPDQLNSEVVAGYLSAEKDKKGVRTALYRAVVNPILTKGKMLLGAELSPKDLHYVADKWVSEVAARGDKFTPSATETVAQPMFAGQRAETANLGTMSEAMTRLENNENPEIVRKETGWERGTDSKLRFEIADDQAQLLTNLSGTYSLGKSRNLGEGLKHDKLYQAYPWLKNIKLTNKVGRSPDTHGWVDRDRDGNPVINVSPTAPNPLATLVHEIQHVVQGYEGFAAGGSTSNVLSKMTPEQIDAEIPRVAATLERGAEADQKAASVYLALANLGDSELTRIKELRARDRAAYEQYVALPQGSSARAQAGERWLAIADTMNQTRDAILQEAGLPPKDETGLRTLGHVLTSDMTKDDLLAWTNQRNMDSEKKKQQYAQLTSGNRDQALDIIEDSYALYDFYRRLSGEVEARTTADRLPLTEAQRQETSPLETREANNEVRPQEEIVVRGSPLPDNSGRTESRAMPSLVPKKDAPLKDRRSTWEKMKDNNVIIRAFVDNIISTTEGKGKVLFDAFEGRQGLRGDLSLRAETAGRKMELSMREAARVKNLPIEAVFKSLEKELALVNKRTNPRNRQQAIKDLDKKYPGVGTALLEIRDLKWSLSRAVAEQIVASANGRPLSPKEINMISTIIQNAETYTTRAYTSNFLKGKSWGSRRMSFIKKNPTSDEARKYNEAIEFLMDRHLVIPPVDDMVVMKKPDLRRIYETWYGEATGVKKADMIKKLAAYPVMTKEAYVKKAEGIARELMGVDKLSSAIGKSYGGARQNRTILEGKKNIPWPVRWLMGEIRNPVAAEMMTVARLINLYTQTRMLQTVVETGEGVVYSNRQEGDFKFELKNEAYGPMKNKFVTQSARDILEPTLEITLGLEQALSTASSDVKALASIVTSAGVSSLRKLTSAVKMVDLVLSPAAMMWNYAGAYGASVQNGVADPRKWVDAQRLTMLALIAHKAPTAGTGNTTFDKLAQRLKIDMGPENMAKIQELSRSRALDSASVGEFQQGFYEKMLRLLEDTEPSQQGTVTGIQRAVQRAAEDGGQMARDAYAFMDMWPKVAAYFDRKQFLTEFNKAENMGWTPEQIVRRAGDEVNLSNISFTRAFKGVKILEKNIPYITMYLTYFADVPRSMAGSAALATRDFRMGAAAKNPKAKAAAYAQGAKRAAGMLANLGMYVGAVSMFLNNLTEDEERRRNTDPEWEQKGVPVVIGQTVDKKPITINVLRVDHNGPVDELLVRLLTRKEDQDFGEIIVDTLKSQLVQAKPVMDTYRLLLGVAGKTTRNYDEDYGKIADWLDDATYDPNLGRNLFAVVEGFTPKPIKGAVRTLSGTVGTRGYEVDFKEEPLVALIQTLGHNPMVRDPEFSLEIQAGKYGSIVKEVQPVVNRIEDRYHRWTGEQLIEKLSPVIEKEEEAYQKLRKVYDGTLAFDGYHLGKDYEQAAKEILDKAFLKKQAINDVTLGSFTTRTIPRNLAREWYDARVEYIRTLPEDQRSATMRKLRTDYRLVVDYLDSKGVENDD